MAIVPMKFVSLCTDRAHLDAMLARALETGRLHPVAAADIITEQNNGKLLNEDNPYAAYRQTIENLTHSLSYTVRAKEHAEKAYTKEEIESFIQELTETFGINSDAQEVILTPDDEKALRALSVCGFERMHVCRYLNFGFGRLPKTSFPKLSMYQDEFFVHHRLHTNSQYIWMVYVTSDSYARRVQKIFHDLYFEPIEIPAIDVPKLLEKYADRIDDIYTYCQEESAIHSLYTDVAVLENKMILSGFVCEKDVAEFQKAFADLPVDFRFRQPAERPNCICPTILKNNWFVRPFELFVEMYSLPRYGDMDPTFFMAITYCVLFGLMFGDLGQGLVLAVLGFALEKKGKLFGIIGRVGITSSVFGFLFGSFFGYEDVLNPLHQRLFHVRTKLFEVMDNSNTMFLLLAAIVIGAVLIVTTQLISTINHARKKDWGAALFSQNGLAGLIFYGAILTAAALSVLHIRVLTPLYIVLCFIVPLLCFLLEEPLSHLLKKEAMRPREGWGGYITQSLFETIEILLSFVTNSMSYLRVGGFVLSHAGMMLVVMTLVEMAGRGGIVVLLVGNAFVMVLEGLIVGIQTLRLEYYEMFSRYYTGGGIKFAALTTHVN